MNINNKKSIITLVLATVLLGGMSLGAVSWSDKPSCTPPLCNASSPINTDTTDQVKGYLENGKIATNTSIVRGLARARDYLAADNLNINEKSSFSGAVEIFGDVSFSGEMKIPFDKIVTNGDTLDSLFYTDTNGDGTFSLQVAPDIAINVVSHKTTSNPNTSWRRALSSDSYSSGTNTIYTSHVDVGCFPQLPILIGGGGSCENSFALREHYSHNASYPIFQNVWRQECAAGSDTDGSSISGETQRSYAYAICSK